MRHLNKLLRISKINTTPFRPQSNGSVERWHAVITENFAILYAMSRTIGMHCCQQQLSFIIGLRLPHTSTKYCPFELVFGRKPPMPGLLQRRPSFPYYDERGDFVSSLKERLRYSHEVARKALINSKEVSKDIMTRRRTR
jgi:hypothetical protein